MNSLLYPAAFAAILQCIITYLQLIQETHMLYGKRTVCVCYMCCVIIIEKEEVDSISENWNQHKETQLPLAPPSSIQSRQLTGCLNKVLFVCFIDTSTPDHLSCCIPFYSSCIQDMQSISVFKNKFLIMFLSTYHDVTGPHMGVTVTRDAVKTQGILLCPVFWEASFILAVTWPQIRRL